LTLRSASTLVNAPVPSIPEVPAAAPNTASSRRRFMILLVV
jgi:hypothetical protein